MSGPSMCHGSEFDVTTGTVVRAPHLRRSPSMRCGWWMAAFVSGSDLYRRLGGRDRPLTRGRRAIRPQIVQRGAELAAGCDI
jgi:hypothetical protein